MTEIRPFKSDDLTEVSALAVRAWQPVFESFASVLGPRIYDRMFPDWRTSQAAEVSELCENPAAIVLVAVVGQCPVGFAGVLFHPERAAQVGEIEMIAVDPGHQRQGIAAALIDRCVTVMTERGCELAVIGTGGDPGHAPARAAYESAGFTALPIVRYYRSLASG